MTKTFVPTGTPFELDKYTTPYEIGRTKLLQSLIPLDGLGRHALDVGCGPGAFTRLLAFRNWRATAIDSAAENVRSARLYAVKGFVGDALTVLAKLPDAYYGLALALEIVEHMPKSVGARLLAELRRVLQPGGRLLLSTPNRWSLEGLGGHYWGKVRGWPRWDAWDSTHVHIYSSGELLRSLRAAGFHPERVHGYFYGGPLPLLGRRTLPLQRSSRWPLNRLGFNVIVEARR